MMRHVARLFFAALCVGLILLTFVLDRGSHVGAALDGY
jgi:hypothetical protein